MNAETLNILRLNSECENALIDFPFHDNKTTWIQEHSVLFANTQKLKESSVYKEVEKNNFIQQFILLYLTKK